MKNYILTPVLVLLLATGTMARAQGQEAESLGLPGDNLNLYAVMELFQKSETLESFERSLNDENSRINNLDLNGDGHVDYIRVIDNVEGNVHNIVLQVAINVRENQDVAVFTVWRESNDRVQIQLTGDESLYGRNYIIEPIFDEGDRGQTPNPGYMGYTQTVNGQNVVVTRTTTFEIAMWPLVRFIFLPTYVVWHSPWYYSYYPSYWHPWRPYYWDYYYGYHYHNYSYYYGHYRHWNDHRYPHWHDSYYSRRTYSPDVHGRIEGGYYKNTYSHPEQRREGTAMYYRTHPDQNYRSSNRTAGSTEIGRTSTQTRTGGNSTNSGTSRRSTSTSTTQRAYSPIASSQSISPSTNRSVSTETRRGSTSTAADLKYTTASPYTRSTSVETISRSASHATERRSTSASADHRSTSAGMVKSASGWGSEQKATRSATNNQSRSAGSNKSVQRTQEKRPSETKKESSGNRGEPRRTN
jgi:hypothetical protein